MKYESRNPATGELLESFPYAADETVQETLEKASASFIVWRDLSFAERAKPLFRVAELLEERAEAFGRLMAEEMGKPLAEGIGEAKKCAWVCRYYAEEAEGFLAEQPHTSDGKEAFVRYDPIGPILAIMPWNFPFWQVFRFAAPTLMAGNVGLLKHAPNTPRASAVITDLMAEAGFPPGVFQHFYLSNKQAAEVIQDPRVAGVTLTGSTKAGRIVAGFGGEALKPMVMELGGSDPFIVFEDASIEDALKAGVFSRCLNNGQSCIAAKRFLIHESIRADFTEKLVARMKGMVLGDPLEPSVNIGPLAREDLRDQLAQQVERSLQAGATALCGGDLPDVEGYFYLPTVLTDVAPTNPAATEEFFGPVAVVMGFSNEEEAIRMANDTEYGLGASVWTQDRERILRMARKLEVGNVFVNGMVKSDPRIPFGGIKASGFGRELGREGILAFVNAKTVWIA